MEGSTVLALLSGGNIEVNRLDDALCDELCAALRARAPSAGEGIKDLEGRNSTGETPFLMACIMGHVECMKLLAGAGCSTAVSNNLGSNALMLAAQSGVIAAVRTALAAGWCELEARDDNCGDTAFLFACFKGSVECMQVLAEAGCDTAAKDKHGVNALMSAAHSGVAAAVRAALAAGWCDLEATSTEGDTAFLLACFKGHV